MIVMIDVIVYFSYSCNENKVHYQDIYIKGHAWKTSDLCNPNYDRMGLKVCSSITSILVALYPNLREIGKVTLEKGNFEYHSNGSRFKKDDYRLDTLFYTIDYLYRNYQDFFNKYKFIELKKES